MHAILPFAVSFVVGGACAVLFANKVLPALKASVNKAAAKVVADTAAKK